MPNKTDLLTSADTIKRGFISTTVYFLSNSLAKVVPIGLMPILTRLLTTRDYGIIGIFNALKICVNTVVSMAGTGAVARAYYDRKDTGFDFSIYIFNAIFVNIILFVVATILLFLGYIFGVIHITPGVLTAALLLTLATVLSGYKTKLWILQKRPMEFSVFDFSRTAVNIFASLLLVYFIFRDWRGRILGILLTDILFCVISCFYLIKQDGISLRINRNYILDVSKFGVPLIPFSIGWALISTVDKFFLKFFLGDGSVGIYTVAYTISTSMLLFITPLDNTLFPHLYEMYKEQNAEKNMQFVYGFCIYSFALVFLAYLITLSTPFLLRYLAGESFRSAGNYVFWLLMSQVFLGMNRTGNRGIFFSKKTYFATISLAVAGIVAVVANYYLIQINGINGAAQATFISCAVLFLMNFVFCQRLYPMPWFSIVKGKK
jgi:O-antigen/teichoic acid export membrane protein